MSPRPDTHDSNSSTSVVVAATSPQKPAERVVAGIAMGEDAAVPAAVVVVAVENPYLAGLGKKTRGLKKKLEKIKKTESLSASGKHLNEEQLKLLETKPLLEFALAEHDRVRVAMETVAKDLKDQHEAEQATEQAAELVEQTRLASLAPPSPTSPPSPLPAALSIAAPDKEQPAVLSIPVADPGALALEADAQDPPLDLDPAATTAAAAEAAAVAAAALSTRTVGVSTETPLTEELGAQTELSGPPPPAGLDPEVVSAAVSAAAALALEEKQKAAEEAEARGVAAGRAEAATGLSKILRLLHVAGRFEAKGERLPTAVDFFSKVLLGKTVPPDEADFDGCLEQSVERAALYLDPSNSAREVAPGVNFEKLNEMVAALREQIIGGPTATEGPVFNFFADASAGRPDDHTATTSRETPRPSLPDGAFNPQRSVPVPAAQAQASEEAPRYQPPPPATPPPVREHSEQPSMVLPPPGSLLPATRPAVGVDAALPAQHQLQQPRQPQQQQQQQQQLSVAGHTAEGEESARSPTAGQLGRQASQMEEGILPPVINQNQPVPPLSRTHPVDQATLQKRERRPKPRPSPRGPVPPYSPAPPSSHYAPQPRHAGLRHQQQVRSPFPPQTTPPLTPVQMGRGVGAPILSPSPPSAPPSGAGPPPGSSNVGYGNGWGYAPPPPQQQQQQQPLQQQPLQQQPLQQQQQQQQLQQQQQQLAYRPPMHPTPAAPRHPEQSAVGVPWAADASPSMYPVAVATDSRLENGVGGSVSGQAGAASIQDDLTQSGFTLTPQQLVQNTHHVPSPSLGPSNAVAMSQPTSLGAPNHWGGVSSGSTPPSPPPPHSQGVPPALGLDQGMTSPWQGAPGDTGGVASPGMTDGAAELGAAVLTRSAGVALPTETGSVVLQGLVAGAERTIQGQQHLTPAQVVPPLAEAPVGQASTPAAQTPAEDTTSVATIKPEEVSPTPNGLAGTVASRARSGPSRGRGASSRARGGRRGDPRNGDRVLPHDGASKDSDDKPRAFQKPRPSDGGAEAPTVAASTEKQAPAAQDQMQGHDGAQRGGRGQRRPREQPRGQQYQRQDQSPRAQQEERLGLGAAQLPLTEQEFASPAQAQGVRANGQRDRRAQAPQPKGRPNPKSNPSPAAKNGWSGGNPIAQPASPTATADPPVSKSWADEEPSPRTQPPPLSPQQQQRAVGVSRNRHPSQQKAPPAEGQRTTDSRGLRQGQGGYGSAPSHEAGTSRDAQQGSRGPQRQYQGRGGGGGGGGGVAGAKPRRPAQIPARGHNGSMSGGGFAGVQGNMRVGNGNSNGSVGGVGGGGGGGGGGGASQGAGPRKGRPAPPVRRKGGGTGGGSGTGARAPQQQQQQQQQQGAPQRAS